MAWTGFQLLGAAEVGDARVEKARAWTEHGEFDKLGHSLQGKKDSSHVEVPVAGWSWNPQERFAYAPGVHCFVAGQEYAHCGASLQECLVPVLTFVATGAPAGVFVAVSEIQWVGLRCRVTVEPAAEGLLADLRTKPNVPNSSITDPKALDADGKTALLVADDSLEGTTVSLVIVDASGRVLSKEPTMVGGVK